MMMIQFECPPTVVPQAIDALASLPIHRIRIFEGQPLPPSPKKEKDFEDRAQKIAAHIRPRSNQSTRKKILNLVLCGGDTFWDQRGEVDPAIRNGTGALSKALRRFASLGDPSPLDMLCTRRREYFSNGPGKGQYKGTRYIPTKLGKRVYDILKERGAV